MPPHDLPDLLVPRFETLHPKKAKKLKAKVKAVKNAKALTAAPRPKKAW